MVQILKESVRNQITEAAELQFAKVGFKKATLGAIAQEANVATGTIYKYFPNKKALFHSIVTDEFIADFSRLTRNRIEGFARPEGIDSSRSYMEGKEGELLHFWIHNRRKVIILLAQSEGTKCEPFAQRYIDDMTSQAIAQARAQFPHMEITSFLQFMLKSSLADSVRGIVSILEHFEDEKSIRKAFDASTTYQLGGFAALIEWNCKQRESL